MLEILFLLLPIAAGYGWYMGRRSIRQNQKQQSKKLSRDYFTGLNFLLSNESDKAVDLFITMLDVDDETIDTHLSLGSLFRKRGEVDRSIRIHQNLIARPSLTTEQRDIAMMELGKDYLAAGFYDRAEEIFLNLVSQDDHSEEAETQLISIYQVTKEWQNAINITKGLSRKRQQVLKSITAHFYCQLADESTDGAEKIKLLQQAIKLDDKCGRAWLTLAKIYLDSNQVNLCKKAILELKLADIELFSDAIGVAKQVYRDTNDAEGYQSLLQQALEAGAGASVIIALAKHMIEQGNTKNAEKMVLDHLYRHPTMKGFQHLMQLHIKQAEDGQAKQSLSMLEKLVEQQIKFRPSYRCCSCGFPAHSLYWHCPSCKEWGSIKRVKGLDGE
ncbi:lipopolysaccharide assembly protein LapB [Shewanella sp. 1_MG-2023]|uniref:Lipopolysaccharide assembly protein B n=1 Tax=Shewanella electrodiphila TaxID=934143 RepID=A0ABT0KMC8_9GAMM|nr:MULTISPECIES: lipopolysaccharide assembly protein LapB [Shewanella]MCL1045006.1 lipopolysaccharide assembly protein LapB [Shewanella electrodiphila]MDO6612356.1 lipopolysaccharide assembly protein LapB [Shewanella sp. 7_MG-2023]MDO6772210.1 lipopolysaccharide assembly protein LapB [Shewanella sp. 2_MG-2023]MDO6794116.1 lipopolysaccharide assembly protein LapB [Shewanella sp. 1_MG-2023]PMG78208.1 lipopolysaccharide assembly protein LapB [Shewanella sp. 10N.286.51.B7]